MCDAGLDRPQDRDVVERQVGRDDNTAREDNLMLITADMPGSQTLLVLLTGVGVAGPDADRSTPEALGERRVPPCSSTCTRSGIPRSARTDPCREPAVGQPVIRTRSSNRSRTVQLFEIPPSPHR